MAMHGDVVGLLEEGVKLTRDDKRDLAQSIRGILEDALKEMAELEPAANAQAEAERQSGIDQNEKDREAAKWLPHDV